MNLRLWLLCLLCFSVSIVPRFSGVFSADPQADEFHWASRSLQSMRKLINAGHDLNYRTFTHHVGHPGSVPTLIMAGANRVGSYINELHGVEPSDPGYIDSLSSSRFACAFVASLAPVALLLGSAPLVGSGLAIFAGLMLALDPRFIALSRIAHLDAMLTLFVTASVFLFFNSVIYRKPKLKFWAGIFWGMAIATKPTAVMVIPALFMFKGMYWLMARRLGKCVESIVSWGDFFIVLVGHVVLVISFTRLWSPISKYRRVLATNVPLADWIMNFGDFLHSWQVVFAPLFVAGSALSISYFLRKNRDYIEDRAVRPLKVHLSILGSVAFTLALLHTLLPQILENVVRFWAWAFGLSSFRHRHFGITWAPPKYGYAEFIATELPSLTLIGLLVGVVCILLLLFLAKGFQEKRVNLVLFCSLVCVVVWCSVLNVSAKQTLRYAMPVVPLIYLVASFGLFQVSKVLVLIFSRLKGFRGLPHRERRVSELYYFGVSLVFCCIACVNVVRSYPHFSLYYNDLSGGLGGAVARAASIDLFGLNESLEKLQAQAEVEGRNLRVAYTGDITALKKTYNRFRRRHSLPERLALVAYPQNRGADFLVLHPNFIGHYQLELASDLERMKLFHEVIVEGVTVLYTYELKPSDFSVPQEFVLSDVAKRTGEHKTVTEGEKDETLLFALPHIHPKGYIAYGMYGRFQSGSYSFSVEAMLPPEVELDSGLTEERYVARLEFGSNCQRVITLGELSRDTMKRLGVNCEFDVSKSVQAKIYWWGNVPIMIREPRFSRAD